MNCRIYAGGNITEFSAKAKFSNSGVLYFGDHIFTDLADPMLQLGWSTAAVVPELAREIRLQNQLPYRQAVAWIEVLTSLIERNQGCGERDDECAALLREWATERRRMREMIKQMFNTQFGES